MSIGEIIAVVALVLSTFSTVMSAYNIIQAQKRTGNTDTKEATEAMTKLTVSLDEMKTDMAAIKSMVARHDTRIEVRNEEMAGINRRLSNHDSRLDTIDGLKIEANFTEVKMELRHIRELLEGSSQKNKGG